MHLQISLFQLLNTLYRNIYLFTHDLIFIYFSYFQVEGRIIAVFSNQPGHVIVHKANEEHAQMVVMGTRGMGTVRRTLMGSVSDYVVHHAHCPVMICRSS